MSIFPTTILEITELTDTSFSVNAVRVFKTKVRQARRNCFFLQQRRLRLGRHSHGG